MIDVEHTILAPAKNMTTLPALIDTPLATVQLSAPDLVEVRFKPGCTLTVAGITAILTVREELGRSGAHRVLFVFPNEETDFEMSMITKDHYQGRPVQEFTRAAAWATRNEHNERFARLYFAYFPSPVPSAILTEEGEARDWLEKQ